MEVTRRVVIKETKATIRSNSQRFIDIGVSSLLMNRRHIESFLKQNREFQDTMVPLEVDGDSPEVIRRMSNAAARFGVGPMAAVAGALADLCLEDMLSRGAQFGMVENGGEIAVRGMNELLVSIFAGASPLSNRLGLDLREPDLPIGIGTSSATVGHAKSLGRADAAVAICENACLADAAATAIGNRVLGLDPRESISRALDSVEDFPDLRGVIVIRGKWVGTWGALPRLVKVNPSPLESVETLFSPRGSSKTRRVEIFEQ